MKEFTTAVRSEEDAEDDVSLSFLHDGREVHFYEPSAGQLAIMSTLSSNSKDREGIRTLISFFFSVMDEETRDYFYDRLMDRNDSFDIDTDGGVLDLFEYMMEEWSGKATKQPSDYRQPRSRTGTSSTAKSQAKGSTSSRSRSRASSASSTSG